METTVRKGQNEFTGWLHDVSPVAATVFLRNVELSPLSDAEAYRVTVDMPANVKLYNRISRDNTGR